jgi:hypothetical protein
MRRITSYLMQGALRRVRGLDPGSRLTELGWGAVGGGARHSLESRESRLHLAVRGWGKHVDSSTFDVPNERFSRGTKQRIRQVIQRYLRTSLVGARGAPADGSVSQDGVSKGFRQRG